MSCTIGENIKYTVFGQSHSEAIGCVLDGVPAGHKIDMESIISFMKRRAPGGDIATPRKESDIPHIVSGLVDNVTCGAPICAVIENSDTRSKDYEKLRSVPRPSHADYPAYVKHSGFNDIRGGGNFSGRMTAPLCFAGALLYQILEKSGIFISAKIKSIYDVEDKTSEEDYIKIDREKFLKAEKKELPVFSGEAEKEMRRKILTARENGDSLGGIIECVIDGVPAGAGEPIFGGIENRLSSIIFGIPAVKGIEFGSGFECSKMTGSEHNDLYCLENGSVKTKTNNHGGIIGGISSGMPIVFRAAIKPTPSVAKPQITLNIKSGEQTPLVIGGRHDPCIVPRAVPAVKAAAALCMADLLLK